MSEYLKNKEYKQQVLKGLILDLHRGRDFEEVKREFNELIKEVDATEIANMEQRLINEGMNPEDIKKLCDVHAAVFRETLSKNEQAGFVPGHPLHTLKHENEEARRSLSIIQNNIDELFQATDREQISQLISTLKKNTDYFSKNLDKHYSKKENILFPYLEKYNITGPPSVMWSVDDEIRDLVKNFMDLLNKLEPENINEISEKVKEGLLKVKERSAEMFFKEESILSPMMNNVLSVEEWAEIKDESNEFGVVFSTPEMNIWQPEKKSKDAADVPKNNGSLELDTGSLTPQQINAVLTNIPIDITFVDENDEVKYFSQGRERIFTRTKSIIGRKVQNCHPPESVHVVEKIINDFKAGKHETAQFWLKLNGAFVHIRYVAIRDSKGKYVGTMEVSQDLTGLRALKGERRLLQYND